MPSPRAILFDLDGTLADSLADITAALTRALADHQLPAPALADVRGWVGGGARQLVELAVAAAGAAALATPVYMKFQRHYAAAPTTHTALYPGIADVLDRLAATHRTLAVLTNKPHELTLQITDQLLARWPFAVIAGHRPGVPLKPSPEPALIVAAELGVPAAACALVGDSPSDLVTAHAAGMIPIAVTWGYRPRAELIAAQPAQIFDEPAQLVALA